jgi:hypothetical protein
MVVLDGNFALSWIGLPLNTYIHCMLERTDAVTNEVLEVITTFVLVFPTVYGENSAVDAWCIGRPCHVPSAVNCIVTVHSVAEFLNTAVLRQPTANSVAVHSYGMCIMFS